MNSALLFVKQKFSWQLYKPLVNYCYLINAVHLGDENLSKHRACDVKWWKELWWWRHRGPRTQCLRTPLALLFRLSFGGWVHTRDREEWHFLSLLCAGMTAQVTAWSMRGLEGVRKRRKFSDSFCFFSTAKTRCGCRTQGILKATPR